MYIIIWEYQIKPEKQPEFESIYSPKGAWAELFEKSTGYLGTELLCDETRPQRYITLDRWASRDDYEAFLAQWAMEYKALDARCEGLTASESLIGKWNSVSQ